MAKILIKNGRIWDGERFFFGDVLTEGSVISKIGRYRRIFTVSDRQIIYKY